MTGVRVSSVDGEQKKCRSVPVASRVVVGDDATCRDRWSKCFFFGGVSQCRDLEFVDDVSVV